MSNCCCSEEEQYICISCKWKINEVDNEEKEEESEELDGDENN